MIRIRYRFTQFAVSAAIVLFSCLSVGVASLPPTIAITGPSCNASFASAADKITLCGYASDDIKVESAIWSNDQGGSDSFEPTVLWSIPDVQLSPGINVITVTVIDGENKRASDSIVVVYGPELVNTVPAAKNKIGAWIFLAKQSAAYLETSFTFKKTSARRGLKSDPS